MSGQLETDAEPPPDEEEDDEPEEAGSSSDRLKPETFQIKGAKIEALRAAFERREWQEAEEDQRLGLLWTIKAKITDALLDSGGDEVQLTAPVTVDLICSTHRVWLGTGGEDNL